MKHRAGTLIASALLVGLMSLAPLPATAQDATPVPPGAADCTVEPRTEEEILAIVDAAPDQMSDEAEEEREARRLAWAEVTIVGPADFLTQQAIRDTVYELIACANADMPLSQYALFTEDAIVNNSPTVEELRGQDPTDQIIDGQVVERAPGNVLDVVHVQLLSNGHVEAVVIYTGEDSGLPFEAFATVFEQVDGRWLFDTP